MIRIKSKRHLFRRCGMAHPKEPVDYKDDFFTEEQLETLRAETMLIVEVIPIEEEKRADELDTSAEELAGEAEKAQTDEPGDAELEAAVHQALEEPARHASPQGEAGGSAPIETEVATPVVDFEEWTVKKLTALLEKRGIEIPKKALKADLIELIAQSA